MGSSESKGASKGANWIPEIYFDPESDKLFGPVHRITADELRYKLAELIDVDEEIKKISTYKETLWDWQLTRFMFFHMFVLLQTNSWWWSIEKNDEGITIQRSKNIDYVAMHYRRQKRKDPVVIEEDTGCYKMMDLVNWIYGRNELNQKYDFLRSNCQIFAQRIFDYFAKEKNVH